jgi:hypothetical protein
MIEISRGWKAWLLLAGGGLMLNLANSFALIDEDSDGMSDIWERIYETTPGALVTGEDPDGDGHDNLTESIAGTDPHDSKSFLGLNHQQVPAGLELIWDMQPGMHYALEASENLIDWQGVDAIPALVDDFQPSIGDPPAPTSYDLLDSCHLWESGFAGFDRRWEWAYGFETNSGSASYGFHDDLDNDLQPNFVESYASTNPDDADSSFQAVLDTASSRVLLGWVGNDGNLRYQMEFEVAFSPYDSSNITGSEFEAFAGVLDADFHGVVADHATDPASLRTLISGHENERRTSGYLAADDTAVPALRHDAEFHDGGDGYILIEWPQGAGGAYAVMTRVQIGDWFYGRPHDVRYLDQQLAGGSPAGEIKFYRVSAQSNAAPAIATLWEKMALSTVAPAEDWDGDGLLNAAEADSGSNPFAWDGDGDGMIDSFEMLVGSDPLVAKPSPFEPKLNTGLVVFTPAPTLFDPAN